MKWIMWAFMLAMNLLIPATMIGFGRVFTKNRPRKINGIYGYRTSRSMKNQDTWDFAHQYCGRLWQKAGKALLIFVIPAQVLTLLCPAVDSMCYWGLALTIVETVVLVATIFPVERALKRTFDKDGNRL